MNKKAKVGTRRKGGRAGRHCLGMLLAGLWLVTPTAFADEAAAPQETASPPGSVDTPESADTPASTPAEAPDSETPSTPHREGAPDLGLGLAFADVPDNNGIGWDVMAGYQWVTSGGTHAGIQFHYMGSQWTSDSFQTLGAFATTRADTAPLSWLQLKAGVVSADSSTTVLACNPVCANQPVSWSGTGLGIGIGLAPVTRHGWVVHIFDVEHDSVAGHDFNIYTASILVFIN